MDKKLIILKKDIDDDNMPIAKIVYNDKKIRKNDEYVYIVDKYNHSNIDDIVELENNKISEFYDYVKTKKFNLTSRDMMRIEDYITNGDDTFLTRDNKEIVKLFEKEESEKNNLRLTNYNMKFQTLPKITSSNLRKVIFIAGKSGSGKSVFSGHYLTYFNYYFKKSKIFFISETDIKNDPAYEDVNNIIQLTKDEITDIAQLDNIIDFFHDSNTMQSIVVFDDVETWRRNKLMNLALDTIKTSILSTGRKQGVSMISINHSFVNANGVNLSQELFETDCVVFFPNKITSKANAIYFLEKKLGLDKKIIDRIFKLYTIPVCINIIDKYIIADHDIILF